MPSSPSAISGKGRVMGEQLKPSPNEVWIWTNPDGVTHMSIELGEAVPGAERYTPISPPALLRQAMEYIMEYAKHDLECTCQGDKTEHSPDCMDCDCGLNDFITTLRSRLKGESDTDSCPPLPVPPHSRLIRQGDAGGCPKCGSSLRGIWVKRCIHPECDYNSRLEGGEKS